MRRFFTIRAAILACATALVFLCPQPGRSAPRQLSVVLYPFIPAWADYKAKLLAGFATTPAGSQIDVNVVDLSSNYYAANGDAYVGRTTAQVYELDSVFLADFQGGGSFPQIQPLPAELVPAKGEMLTSAERGATVNGTWYGVPHWVCSDFIFYRAGDAALQNATTLDGLHALWPTQPASESDGMLIDAKGKSTLGELYLMSEVDRAGGDLGQVYGSINAGYDKTVFDNIREVRDLCAPTTCRSAANHQDPGTFYGRAFSDGRGRGLIGYSEYLNGVLAESSHCGVARCLSDSDLGVQSFPLDAKPTHAMVWVDSFVIAKSCVGQCLTDAIAFIKYATAEDTVLGALIDDGTGVPRYLLPARASLYSNARLLAKAHLYPALRDIVENAVAPSEPSLNERLRQYGGMVDAGLDPSGK